MISPPRLLYILAAAMMLIALAPLPYGYYQLLRLVVLVAAGWAAFYAFQGGRQGWAIAFGLMALIFNPVFPIHLDREIWSVLNVIGAGLFGAGLWVQHVSKRASATSDEAPRRPPP